MLKKKIAKENDIKMNGKINFVPLEFLLLPLLPFSSSLSGDFRDEILSFLLVVIGKVSPDFALKELRTEALLSLCS